jgi:hypothetical protein
MAGDRSLTRDTPTGRSIHFQKPSGHFKGRSVLFLESSAKLVQAADALPESGRGEPTGQTESVTRDISRSPRYISSGPLCISKGCSVHFKGALPMSTSQRHCRMSIGRCGAPTTSLETRPKGTRDISEAPRHSSKKCSVHFIWALGTF